MHHLGSWASALADGQLGPAESERALAHVAGCPTCASHLSVARQARRALSVVPDAEPAPDLTARLLALAAMPPVDPDGRSVRRPGTRQSGDYRSARMAPIVPLGSSAYAVPARALTGDLTTRHIPWLRIAAGSAAGLVVVGASLFQLGDRPSVVPSAHLSEALSILGGASGAGSSGSGTWAPSLATQISAVSTGSARGSDAATDAAILAWMDDAGWTCPVALPDGYEITAARLVGEDDGVLELDLSGPDGRIVVTEERGQLERTALTGAAQVQAGDRIVYVLTRQPWHAVWQSGDTVVSIVTEASSESAAELVADFPPTAFDDGMPARLARGWDTVTGAFAHP